MKFFPCEIEPDMWMRDMDTHHEHIAVCVDDMLIVSKNPKEITDILVNKHKFKLKETGPIKYYLGCDFYRDEEGALCFALKRHVEKMIDIYKNAFGVKPKLNISSPLEKRDYSELDISELLDQDGIQKYQSLIGALQ